MRVEVRAIICADYIAVAVDTIRGRIKSTREVNRGVLPILERKAMRYSGSVEVIANDQPGIIYFAWMGLNGSRIVNGLTRRGRYQIAMNESCIIIVNADDRIVVIYPEGFCKTGSEVEDLLVIEFHVPSAGTGGSCLYSILFTDLKEAVLAVDRARMIRPSIKINKHSLGDVVGKRTAGKRYHAFS